MVPKTFKTTLRHLRHHKLFTGLNIFGLAIGLASAILLFLWVRDEMSYDRFNPDAGKIFRLTAQVRQTPSALNPADLPC